MEVKYDSTWYTLLGDTIAHYEAELAKRKWTAPKTDYTDADDCADSLGIAVDLLDTYDGLLTNCDLRYRTDYRLRNYTNTITYDEDLELTYDIDVTGKFPRAPKFTYRILRPDSIIRITERITETIVKRKVFIGGAIGPRLPWESDRLGAIEGSLVVGYSDKKNNSYALRGDFSQSDYAVLFEYRRSFDVNWGK